MKSNKKKTKAKSRSKSKSHAKAKPRTSSKPKTSSPAGIEAPSSPSMTFTTSSLKTCQEVEVGDIGGFGSTTELEEHEKRCSETATEFCTNCGKNLCHNHYDLLHRDHDRNSGQSTGANPL